MIFRLGKFISTWVNEADWAPSNTSLTNGRGSWVVGVGVGVGVGEELIMIIHMKLIATFALCRIALRRHPVKSPKS